MATGNSKFIFDEELRVAKWRFGTGGSKTGAALISAELSKKALDNDNCTYV